MDLLIDTANIESIKAISQKVSFDGITMNPTLLSMEKDNASEALKYIQKSLKEKAIHVQTTATRPKDILHECKILSDYFGNLFYIKIPMTEEGLKATYLCKEAGYKVTITTVFTPVQALLAAKAGADYIAPYVDRLDNITCDGANVVKEILGLLQEYKLKTKVLAASFKNVRQVYEVASYGTHAVTISPNLFDKLFYHPFTDKSLADFEDDWNSAFQNKRIIDLL